jgi:hypothetical protein
MDAQTAGSSIYRHARRKKVPLMVESAMLSSTFNAYKLHDIDAICIPRVFIEAKMKDLLHMDLSRTIV